LFIFFIPGKLKIPYGIKQLKQRFSVFLFCKKKSKHTARPILDKRYRFIPGRKVDISSHQIGDLPACLCLIPHSFISVTFSTFIIYCPELQDKRLKMQNNRHYVRRARMFFFILLKSPDNPAENATIEFIVSIDCFATGPKIGYLSHVGSFFIFPMTFPELS